MILYYFILGSLIAMVGALPTGTVNLAVVHSSIRENTKNTLHIIAAAGIGEVILATVVLYGSVEISLFLENNIWIHLLVTFLFLCIGLYLIIFRKKTKNINKFPKNKSISRKYIMGFLLAIINPPVFAYWITAITLSNLYFLELNMNTSLLLVGIFFTGVYLGKTFILYLYSLWGKKIALKSSNTKHKTAKITGVILIFLAIFQCIKLWVV